MAAYFIPSFDCPSDVEVEHSKDDNRRHRIYHFDFTGLLLLTLSLSSLLWVLDAGSRKLTWDVYDGVRSLVCLALFVAYFVFEGFWAKEPLTPLWLIKKNGIGLLCLVQIFLFWGRLAVRDVLPTISIFRCKIKRQLTCIDSDSSSCVLHPDKKCI